MTSMKLTPCAKSLWEWTLLQAPAGCWIDIDLKDFQAVSAEYRSKSYSMKQIRRALGELEELQLIATKSERVRMQARHPGPVMNRKQKSEQQEIKTQKLASAPGTFLSTPQKLTPEPGTFLSTPQKLTPEPGTFLSTSGTFLSTPETLMSKSKPETPAVRTSQTPTDLYRSIKENKEADLLKISREEQESTRESPASLVAEPKPAGSESKLAGSDQSTAAPTAIKETLAALYGGSARTKDAAQPQPRRREITRPIPSGYIEEVRLVLTQHQRQLEKLGIDLANNTLLETVNAHAHNLEPAIAAFLENCAKGAIANPNSYLSMVVRQGWKPRNQQSTSGSPKSALSPEFLKAYERLKLARLVLPEPPESLPVIMGVVNVRIPNPNPRPWEPPHQLMPWDRVLTQAVESGQLLEAIGDLE